MEQNIIVDAYIWSDGEKSSFINKKKKVEKTMKCSYEKRNLF